ncbi:unnamed protein product [Nesidiocoris tenuis]|uniref:Uncharacterized protein n=1 Tax=Nesidiocoris tenuis TaxID=355587 RepID=A0A6H5HBX8_9HEMI|nr:unnamed protein product [Nesidiocoris tenuis]
MHHKAELCRMWNASPSCDEEEEWRLRRSCSFLRAESRRTFLPNFLNLFNNCRCRKTASESERRFYPEKRELLANLELQSAPEVSQGSHFRRMLFVLTYASNIPMFIDLCPPPDQKNFAVTPRNNGDRMLSYGYRMRYSSR